MRRLLLAFAVAALAASAAMPAAAADPVATPRPEAAASIAFTDDRGRRIELPRAPQRVVSLLPSLTETVCALEACARLVGTDRYSNWPAAVRALPKLGGLEDAQLERIVALKPDLVLVANAPRVIERLEALGVPVVMLIPQSFDDARRVAGVVAAALGDAPAGERLWRRVEQRIADAAARVPPALRGQRVYLEVASTPFAAGRNSFVGEVLARLGMDNVVPPSLGPFPQLAPEFVVRAQPDVIIGSARAVAEMPSRPGWAALRALKARRTCGIAAEPWDTLVRSGPRLADAAEVMADCLVGLPAVVAAR